MCINEEKPLRMKYKDFEMEFSYLDVEEVGEVWYFDYVRQCKDAFKKAYKEMVLMNGMK